MTELRSKVNLDRLVRGLDDEHYLARLADLTFDPDIDWTPEAIVAVRERLCPWHHNIKLADGLYTAYVDEFYPAHREVMEVVNHALGGDFEGKRVVDIGCLEGYFSVECALQGAQVLGVDGKRVNLTKCEFVNSVLGIESLAFAHDDAMRVTRERYGGFDAVLALGLLYHLEDPFTFLRNMAGLCDGFVLIDTLVALEDQPASIAGGWEPELSELRAFEYAGREYAGRLFREFDDGSPQVGKELSTTASLTNDVSVWLTEASLVALLRDVGFQQVDKLAYGSREDLWWADVRRDGRVLLLAHRARTPFRSKVFA